MIRSLLALVLWGNAPCSALTAAPEPPAPEASGLVVQQTLALADKAISSAETIAQEVEGSLDGWLKHGPPDAYAECLATSPDLMVERLAKRAQAPGSMPPDTRFSPDLVRHYIHRALEKDDPGACAVLKADSYRGDRFWGGKPAPGDWPCRSGYYDLAFARAIIARRQDFSRICRQRLGHDAPELSGESAEICQFLLQNSQAPAQACARFKLHQQRVSRHTLEDNPEWAKNICPAMFHAYQGDESLCGSLKRRVGETGGVSDYPRDKDVEACLGIAAFARAHKAKNREACKDSLICRSLMGEQAKAAEAYAARFKENECLSSTRPPPMNAEERSRWAHHSHFSKGRSLTGFLDQAMAFLDQVEMRMPLADMALAQAIDARREKVIRLKWRYSKLKAKLPAFRAAPPSKR